MRKRSYLERLRDLKGQLSQERNGEKRQEILDRMLFLVEAEQRERKRETKEGDQPAGLDPALEFEVPKPPPDSALTSDPVAPPGKKGETEPGETG
jgi:hypothetical protein